MNGNIQFMVSVNSYMFQHQSAIGRQSLQAKMPWANTPFQILTTLTVMIRILTLGLQTLYIYHASCKVEVPNVIYISH